MWDGCRARVRHTDRRGKKARCLRRGMRSVAVERHVVFYRAFGPDVVILRVVHQRRDMAAMGFEG